MSDTDFTARVTRIKADWLNDLNQLRYGTGSTSRGSALLEHTPSGTGAVPSTTRDELDRHIVSSLRFMSEVQRNDVLGHVGGTSVSSPYQKIIDYAMTKGCTVDTVPGKYLLDMTHTVSTDNCVLKGRGPNTQFVRTADYGSTFVFTGNDATGATLNYCGLSDCQIFNLGTMTSGAHVWLNGAFIFYGGGLRVSEGFTGYRFTGARRVYLDKLEAVYASGVATGRVGMLFDSAAATYAHPSCAAVIINNFNVQGPSSATGVYDYGVLIKTSDGIWLQLGHLGAAAIANYCLSAEVAGAKEFINHAYLDLVEIDSIAAASAAVRLKGNTNQIFASRVSNATFHGGASGNHGLLVDALTDVDGFELNGATAFSFNQESMKLLGGRNYKISNFNSRAASRTSTGTYSGIYLENVAGAQFDGGSSGRDNLGSLTIISQKYGIEFGAGNTDVTLDGGMDLQGNVLGSISGGAGQYRTGSVLLEKTPSAKVLANLVKVGGANFNGTTTYLDNTALTGVVDSKKFTFVAKLRFANAATTVENLVNSNVNQVQIQRSSNGVLQVIMRNAANTIILSQGLANTITAAGTYIILVSADMAVPDSMRIYVNDATDTLAAVTFTDDTIDFTPGEYSIGATVAGANFFAGDIYCLGIASGVYADFSMAANRRKFFDRVGNKVDWGKDGSDAFGTIPFLYLGGAEFDEWDTNRGSGTGAFTRNGTLAVAATSDYGYPEGLVREFTVTAASYTLGSTVERVIGNRAGGTITVTLPSATTQESIDRGVITLRTVQAQAIVSASSNVVPLTGGAAGTAMVANTSGKWAQIKSNGTEWQVISGN